MASSSSSSSWSSSGQEEEQQQDRIGALPDPMLVHILSFLPTLDAVRTSVLSTRWRTLWTAVGALDLDEEYNNDFFSRTRKRKRKRERKGRYSFEEFAGEVLSFHDAPALHKLRFSCIDEKNFSLTHCVYRTAVSRRAHTLDLRFPRSSGTAGSPRWQPSLLFAIESLVDLRLDLSGSALILPGTLALVGLRRMRLCRAMFWDDHSTRCLFSSCTALRSLALDDCSYYRLDCLEISCSSLQELAIEDGGSFFLGDGLQYCQLKIAAPHLTSFVYRSSVAQAYIVDPHLLFLEYAKIKFKDHDRWIRSGILDRVRSFLSSLSSVRNLHLCHGCVEALRESREVPFCNLNVLRASVWSLHCLNLCVVLRLLRLNPHLKVLIVEAMYPPMSPSSLGKVDFLKCLADCFESRDGVVERVEISCKVYTFRFSTEVIRYSTENVLELVRVLFGSQACLKKLILSSSLFYDSNTPDYKRDAVMEKVLSFPRLTPGLAVSFM